MFWTIWNRSFSSFSPFSLNSSYHPLPQKQFDASILESLRWKIFFFLVTKTLVLKKFLQGYHYNDYDSRTDQIAWRLHTIFIIVKNKKKTFLMSRRGGVYGALGKEIGYISVYLRQGEIISRFHGWDRDFFFLFFNREKMYGRWEKEEKVPWTPRAGIYSGRLFGESWGSGNSTPPMSPAPVLFGECALSPLWGGRSRRPGRSGEEL